MNSSKKIFTTLFSTFLLYNTSMYAKGQSSPYSEDTEELHSSKTSSRSKAKKNTKKSVKKTFWEKYQYHILITGGFVAVIGTIIGAACFIDYWSKKRNTNISNTEQREISDLKAEMQKLYLLSKISYNADKKIIIPNDNNARQNLVKAIESVAAQYSLLSGNNRGLFRNGSNEEKKNAANQLFHFNPNNEEETTAVNEIVRISLRLPVPQQDEAPIIDWAN